MTPQQIIDDWKQAYKEVKGKEPPHIEFFRGWYKVGTFNQQVRASEIIEMTEHLRKSVRDYEQIRLIIPGTTPSVNHMYKDKWIKGRKYQVLTDEAKAWAEETIIKTRLWRNRTGWRTANGKVVVNVWFYFPDMRKRDTHNGLKLLLDCLEHAEIYTNDRYALPRIMDWDVDKDNPRIELEMHGFQEAVS